MPKPVLLLENFLPYRLSVLTNLVSSAIAGAYRERFGLSIPEWRVVAVLANSPTSPPRKSRSARPWTRSRSAAPCVRS